MRFSCAGGLAAVLLTMPAAGQERSASPIPDARSTTDCAGEVRPDRLQGLTRHDDLILASGDLAKLSGIRLPDSPPHREAALAWLRDRLEQPVSVQSDGTHDRWNRLTVRIRMGDSHKQDLGRGLVAAGLALVDPGAASAFCQPELLALEETARDQRLGLWANGGYNPINAKQVDRLRERIGSFVLVEGRVHSVGERKHRTYLNFGGHWAEDFTIIIPQRTWKLLASRGVSAETLTGQRIRARGILQAWQGTALTIVIPDMIERLEDRRLPR